MASVDIQALIAIMTVAASAGAAWAGVRTALNGTRESVKQISETLAEHVAADHAVQVQAAATASRIEQKCESMCERLDELRDRVKELGV